MSANAFSAQLIHVAERAGITIPDEAVAPLGMYYALLQRWNRSINLTALPLDDYAPKTLERLFLEPAVAARFLEDGPINCVDLGSGGGSPAIPLKILRHQMRLTMVESKHRKAAFLREAVRELGLTDVVVFPHRVEDLATDVGEIADVVTARGLRIDDALAKKIRTLLAVSGRLFLFGGSSLVAGFDKDSEIPLGSGAFLYVLRPRRS